MYHLEKHPSGILEKIDTAIGDRIIDKKDGLDQLIAYLDTIYGEDEMADAWNKYKDVYRSQKNNP